MHARRLASFFLGIWLAGSLFMAWIAHQNLKEIDRLLAGSNPVARLNLKSLGPEGPAMLRYTAAEQIRWYRTNWDTVQLIAGTGFLLIMLFGSRENKFILLGFLVLVLVTCAQKFLVTPELMALGRLLDFPQAQLPPETGRYGVVNSAYYGIETAKGVLILILTAQMVFSRKRSGRSRDARRKLDHVDKPDYRRVYR
jgi:hypothetical protein